MYHYRKISYKHLPFDVAIGLSMAWKELHQRYPVDVDIELIFLMDAPEEEAVFSFKRRWRGLCQNDNGTFRVFIRVGRFYQMYPVLAHEYQHVIDREHWAGVKYSASKINEAENIIENAAERIAWAFAMDFANKHPQECYDAEKASKKWLKRTGVTPK